MGEDRVRWECPKCGKAYSMSRGQVPPEACPDCRNNPTKRIPTDEQVAEWESAFDRAQGRRPGSLRGGLPSEDRLYYSGLAYRILRLGFLILIMPVDLIALFVLPIAGIALLFYTACVYVYLKWCESLTRHY